MRVLHVIPLLWSGAGNVVTRLCRSQAARHDVAIVTAGRSNGESDWRRYRRHLDEAGVTHHRIDFFDRRSDVYWGSIAELGRLVATWEPDIVHTHAGVATGAAAIVRDRVSPPFRLIAHCYNWRPGRPSWMDAMDLWGFARADRVVCSARAYQATLERGGVASRRVVYLPWGLPTAEIDAAVSLRRGRRGRRGPTIGCLGRLEPRKGQLELCHAFRRCRRRVAGAHLDLVGPAGDTGYVSKITRYVRSAGLRQAVSLPGSVGNVHARMAGWDLAVSLSTDEGQGLAVLEAMAVGVPLLARPSPGIEDFLRHDINGFAVTETRATAVGDTIATLLAQPDRLGAVAARARRFVRARYSWARTVRAIEALYVSASKPTAGTACGY